MYAIYMWSEYSSLSGYWTGRFVRATQVPNNGMYRVLNGEANVPVLVNNIHDKSIKIYKSKVSVIKAADSMTRKVQELVPEQLVVKTWESGYWNSWNITVIDLDTNKSVYRTLCGKIEAR